MMAKSIGHGIHASAHDGSDKPGPVSTRAVRLYLATQAESGHMCPITMTHACIGALRSEPALLAKWLPKIQTRTYDPRPLPWWEKNGVTLGMGMTERQGGTDVRANITQAVRGTAIMSRSPATNGSCRRRCAMPSWCSPRREMGQEGGLTCYLMPRYRPDGSQNAIRFQRLKDKLGNKSNASSEVEFHGAYAERVGAEGAGVRTIIEMVNLTRLDCAIASAGQIAHCAQPGAEPHPQSLGVPAPARRPAVDARHRGRPGARARGAGRAGVPPLPRLGARRIGSGARRPTCGC